MLRMVCIFCLAACSLTGCHSLNLRGVADSTLRRPNGTDVDDEGSLRSGDVNGWGGSDFRAARQNAPHDTPDLIMSPEARGIERRMGIE